MRRCLLACVIVVSPIIGVIAFQGTSLAAVPDASGVQCPVFAGTLPTVIAGGVGGSACSNIVKTDGVGTFKMTGGTTAKIRWHAYHRKTLFYDIAIIATSPNSCSAGYTEDEITGGVSGARPRPTRS
jgi:hypothetical protein